MGQLVFILGRSGTGKSFSMRNFPPEKLAVVNVQGKILPFRGSAAIEATAVDQSEKIIKALEIYAKNYKSIVIDDYQYVMANEFMRRSAERGYDKFTEIARHAWDIANTVRDLPPEVIVYVMCHTDRDDEGNEKIKTIGKLLDEKICLEGMSTIVLKTNVSDGQYSFLTQNNGRDTTKSPAGMFPSYAIENDLYYVDQKIRNYYGFTESLTDDEIAEIDEAAKKDDIPIGDDGKKRRGRRNAKKEESAKAPAEEKKEETAKPDTNADEQQATDAGSEGPKKRVRRTSEKSREEVAAENAENVANAGMEEAGDSEEVDFNKVENPSVGKLPRRRRGAKNEQEQESSEKEETEGNQEEEKSTEENTGKIPARTRKVRNEEETAMNEPEPAEETPTPRRRRRRA